MLIIVYGEVYQTYLSYLYELTGHVETLNFLPDQQLWLKKLSCTLSDAGIDM